MLLLSFEQQTVAFATVAASTIKADGVFKGVAKTLAVIYKFVCYRNDKHLYLVNKTLDEQTAKIIRLALITNNLLIAGYRRR